MFKFLAKSAVFSLVWSRYRKVILSTVILFGIYFTVSLMHKDYLEYAKLSHADNIALSYVFKWATLLLASIIYYWTNMYQSRAKSEQASTQAPAKASSKSKARSEKPAPEDTKNDPFAEIRKKGKLSSKAEQILKD